MAKTQEPLEQRWSPARCMFVLYYSAALADRQFSRDEAVALTALVVRAPSLHELSDKVVGDMTDEIIAAHAENRLAPLTEKALKDLPADEGHAIAVYANCADIIRADRAVEGSEKRFMERLAKRLNIPPKKSALIDKVMDAKNQH